MRVDLIFLGFLFLLISACEKDVVQPVTPPSPPPSPVEPPPPPPVDTATTSDTIVLDLVSGLVQKGPYLNGTDISISELRADLTPTGRTFSSQTVDNRGTFEMRNVELLSPLIEVKADGFYYNEVTDDNSPTRLTLFAFSDLSDRSTLNVNLLSTVERRRVQYLVENGSRFEDAKRQARGELLALFEMQDEATDFSEDLDISREGDNNAKLLAISLILQGYLEVADLSQLLADISTDLREDGQLNSQPAGSRLMNNARRLIPAEIRSNLEKRYADIGDQVTIPAFEPYLQTFIDSSDFEATEAIVYPPRGQHGENILLKDSTNYRPGDYSLAAILPEKTGIRIKIAGANWFVLGSASTADYDRSEVDWSDTSRVFTSQRTGELDYKIILQNHNPVSTGARTTRVYLYENGATDPLWVKEFIVPGR